MSERLSLKTFSAPRSRKYIHTKNKYLGIIFHRNGSFTAANTELRAKALRALFGLKGNIVKDALSHCALNILFDSLIKPILL